MAKLTPVPFGLVTVYLGEAWRINPKQIVYVCPLPHAGIAVIADMPIPTATNPAEVTTIDYDAPLF